MCRDVIMTRTTIRAAVITCAMVTVAACQEQVLPSSPQELNRRLIAATRQNNPDEIRRLIAEGAAADLLTTSIEPRQTPLLVACETGHVEAVEVLLGAGANPNRREGGSIWGDTPLMVASRFGYDAVVERLLDGGANPLAWHGPFQTDGVPGAGGGSYTALGIAVAYGHPETVRRLLLAGASIGPGQGNLYNAITKGSVELVRLMLAAGANPREPFPWNGRTPLQEAQRLTGASRAPIVTVLQQYLMPRRPASPPLAAAPPS